MENCFFIHNNISQYYSFFFFLYAALVRIQNTQKNYQPQTFEW